MYYSDANRVYDETGLVYDDTVASVDPPAARVSEVNGGDQGSRFALAFGPEWQAAYPVTLYDPAKLFEECNRLGLPVDSWYGKANSFTCPLGSEPGIGYFLVSYKDAAKFLDQGLETARSLRITYSPAFSLRIYDVSGEYRQADYLYATRWECVTPGHPTDDNAIYLLTVRDLRTFGVNTDSGWDYDTVRTMSFPLNPQLWSNEYPPQRSAFNIPKANAHGDGGANSRWFLRSTTKAVTSPPAVLDDEFVQAHAISVAGGIVGNTPQSLWSWAEMLTMLGLKNVLYQGGGGTDPASPVTLPYTPTLPPMDFDFSYTSPWMAIASVLDRLSLALKFNPFGRVAAGSGFLPIPTLCVIGQPDGDREAALASIADYLVWDRRGQDVGSPAPVLVRCKYFPYISTSSATYAVSGGGGGLVTIKYWSSVDNERVGQQFANANTNAAIGADAAFQPAPNFAAMLIDHDAPYLGNSAIGQNVNYNQTTLWASANQHLWFARQSTLSARSLNRIYAGFHTADGLLPGSMMKLIRWEDCGRGPRTHVYCGDGYLPPHALYHLVNPHRFHRTDDLRRWQSIEGLDVSKL